MNSTPWIHPLRGNGFTLVEAMIVVVIIGILASIAYPSYLEHIRKARRADAQASLMELAQFMERYYTSSGRYLDANGDPPTLPFVESPKDGSTKYYDLSLNGAQASTYTLVAAPKGAMTGDDCGSMAISHTGAKSSTGALPTDSCWRN